MSENAYELAGRLAKATKIADVLYPNFTAAELERCAVEEPELYEEMWVGLTAHCKLAKKPSEPTRAKVLELLRNREKAAANFPSRQGASRA